MGRQLKLRLSEFELDVLGCFWDEPERSAPEVFAALGAERGVTYSTIKTVIDRLEQKGVLKRIRVEGRTIYYGAAVEREEVGNPLVSSLLRRLYGRDMRPLFAHLLKDEALSDDELAYLRKLVAKKKGRAT